MDCPYCRTANPAQARFCLGCGRSLHGGLVCATCHTLLPAHARYCFHCGALLVPRATACLRCGAAVTPGQAQCAACGTDLSWPAPAAASPALPAAAPAAVPLPEPVAAPAAVVSSVGGRLPAPRSLQDMLPSLHRYLPAAVCEPLERRPTAEDVERACARLAAVLKTAKTYLPGPVVLAPQPPGVPAGGLYHGTFLFVDVSGFTPLSERLSRFGRAGAERITGIINDLFNDLVGVLHAHGGTLLKFGGDALLGLFGDTSERSPETLADGALRATQAALAMQGCMGRFVAVEAAGETRALRIKCGISSGPFFAAHIGTRHSMAYVTTGHTVNRADQAESHATPGDVVLGQATLDLIAGQVEVEPRDEGFYLLRSAPAMPGASRPAALVEPPPGKTPAQMTYLVDRLDRLTPYMSPDLVQRIVNSPDPERVVIVPDHRTVTVMFANYEGVSALIEDMADSRPDIITQRLNDYFVHMAEIVERTEGTLARMDQYSVGDRLVIFFGAPRAHEDDPLRAVYTALDMQEATRRHFSALQLPQGIYRFRQRIGINTGHLFAGNVGAPDLRQEYTLMGDDINMAARLMSRAEWGEILVSNKTQQRVAAFVELRDRGQLKVKGKEILIPTFQVLGHRAKIGRTRGLGSGDGPLADREDELLALKRCGQALQAGRGQIVSLIGESGLGKSRLMRELKHWLFGQEADAGVRWLEGHALSFSEQVSYWLAAHVLHRAVGLQPGAGADDTLYALWDQGEAVLGKATAREAIPFLAHLLDLPLEGDWKRWVTELDPQVRQKQTFWAVREFCTASARQQPLVIALDDLHWADEASLALVEDLLQVTDHAPLMLCLVFRGRRDKGCWRLRDRAAAGYPHRYTEVTLQPLARAVGRLLLQQLLPGADLSGIEQDILDKAEGNPFYLEEVVRSLIDSQAVVPEAEHPDCWQVAAALEHIAVPDSLQGAILARIDRLTEDARQALQMASVIGRRFQLEALRGLAGAEAEMESWLAQLERSGLVRPVSPTNPEYTFPDALVHEVAYDTLLVQRRREFHRRVGETLEAILGDRAEQECELLAYHFGHSDDQERSRYYVEMAGHRAQAGFANETAIRHYSLLLEHLAADGSPSTRLKQFDVLARRQKVYGLTGKQKERQADLEQMLALATELGDEGRRADTLNAYADFYQWTSRYAEAEQAATAALAAKTELHDQAGQAEALHQIGVAHYVRGDLAVARPFLEQAVALRQATDNVTGEAWSQMYLGMIHFMQGDYGLAAGLHGQALQVAEARQDWYHEGIYLTNAARVSLRLGQYDGALDLFRRSLEKKRRVGDRPGQGFALAGMALILTYRGSYDEAETLFQESLTLRHQVKEQRGVGTSLQGLGLVALGRGRHAEAVDLFRQALDVHTPLGVKTDIVVDLSLLGQAHLAAGDLDQALEASGQALALLAGLCGVEEVQQVYLNHYRVLAARQDAAAGSLLAQAYEAMMDLARRIDDPEQRQVFLEQVKTNCDIVAAMQGNTAGSCA